MASRSAGVPPTQGRRVLRVYVPPVMLQTLVIPPFCVPGGQNDAGGALPICTLLEPEGIVSVGS